MFNAIILSIVFLCLTGVAFICVVGTVLPLLLTRSNIDDLMPIAEKGVKVGILLAGISGVLELVSPGDSVVRNPIIVIVTVTTFAWSWGLLYLLRYRERRLLS
ncbi:MAG: hypothetical protein PVJ39_21990 [Gammaproteobacteria bacterium]|jgi:hypothetical protein